MEPKTAKIWQTIIGIILVVALAMILVYKSSNSKSPENFDESVLQDPNIVARQLCFIWNTEAGDKAQLSMDLRGNQVIGEFNWLPFEKDKKTGVFKGTVSAVDPYEMGRTVNAWWESSSEGVTNTEQIIIKFGEGNAAVGFGPMIEDAEGRWVYEDPTKLSFAPNLTDTDCGDEAMD